MSALIELYGLKLYKGTIKESQIPETYRKAAIEHCNKLKKEG